MRSDPEKSTLLSHGQPDFLETGLELRITGLADGAPQTLTLQKPVLTLGRQEGERRCDVEIPDPAALTRQAQISVQGGTVFFTNNRPALPALVNGVPKSFAPLQPGDTVEIGGLRLELAREAVFLALLEGCTGWVQGRTWRLSEGKTRLGRPGPRANEVEVDDPTVSRAHAVILAGRDGCLVEPESSTNPTFLNGEPLSGPAPLRDGDLLRLGSQVLRFRRVRPEERIEELELRQATILFTDIWDYSTFAERMNQADVARQLNEFYSAMGRVIMACGGRVMTFLGDAVMAVFGAEKDPRTGAPLQAVHAATRMQQELLALNDRWSAEGRPTFRIGVGINTGEVMAGHLGFSGKHEFGAVGDNTNLAARLEKLTRQYDVAILVSASTAAAIAGEYRLRSLGEVSVKGRQEPVEVFEVQASPGGSD